MTDTPTRCEPPERMRGRDWKPRFGDLICNGYASENNPTRLGYFVRRGIRTGFLNRGPYWQLTDRKGKFWEIPENSDRLTLVTRADAVPSPAKIQAMHQLIADLSASLADEGCDWSHDGLQYLRRRVAETVPADMLPDFLKDATNAP